MLAVLRYRAKQKAAGRSVARGGLRSARIFASFLPIEPRLHGAEVERLGMPAAEPRDEVLAIPEAPRLALRGADTVLVAGDAAGILHGECPFAAQEPAREDLGHRES